MFIQRCLSAVMEYWNAVMTNSSSRSHIKVLLKLNSFNHLVIFSKHKYRAKWVIFYGLETNRHKQEQDWCFTSGIRVCDCLIINLNFHRHVLWAHWALWSAFCRNIWVSESCLAVRALSAWTGLSSEDGSEQSMATGIKNHGRDYFKCQHNVTSCVRRSNVQTVLSGEQLIDQVQFVLLWLLWWLD